MVDNKQTDVDLNSVLRAFTEKMFTLILLPTEQCNFRCTYCYEDYKSGRMSCEIIGAVKKYIRNLLHGNPDLQLFGIAWFGGEPLLVSDIVLDILKYAKDLCDESGVQFTSNISTNGSFLTKPLFHDLVSLNLRQYQITLDGPRDVHNKTRVKVDGSGTFDTIWDNMVHMHETDLKFGVTLRVHVSPENKMHINTLVKQIGKVFSGDDRFSVFIRGISDLGGEKSISVVGVLWKNRQIPVFQI